MTIDHEGGRVLRLRGEFTDIPSAREVGRANNLDLTREWANSWAASCAGEY